MGTAYRKMYEYLESKFGGNVPYFSIEHRLTHHPIGDSVEHGWRVYVSGYNQQIAPSIDQAIAMLDEEIAPSQPGCIGVGV